MQQNRRKFRELNAIDDHNRAAIGYMAMMSMRDGYVVEFLEDMICAGRPASRRIFDVMTVGRNLFHTGTSKNPFLEKKTLPPRGSFLMNLLISGNF